jgi:hypothetical protein
VAGLLPFHERQKSIRLKKNILLLSITLVATVFILQGCLNDQGEVPPPPETKCDSLNVSYNLHVKPLAETKCANSIGCHVAGGSGPGDFTTYAGLSAVSQTIADRIKLPVSDPLHMPQGATLTQEELDIFLCWIEDGAQNN